MTIAHDFEYLRPKTLDEALAALAAAGTKARVLAGGTDLLGWLKDGLVTPDLLVDVKDLEELAGLEVEGTSLLLGANVTFAEVLHSDVLRERLPLLWEAAGTVASCGLRNRATVVGNLCSAVPCCDSGPALLVHEAVVELQAAGGRREVPIGSWFLGPRRTAARPDELVTGLRIPLSERPQGGCYVKLGRYRGEDLAQAGVAVLVDERLAWRIAFGAVAPTPLRGPLIETLAAGKPPTVELFDSLEPLLPNTIAPITDVRATKAYRLHMVGVMLGRAMTAAHQRLTGCGPAYGRNLLED